MSRHEGRLKRLANRFGLRGCQTCRRPRGYVLSKGNGCRVTVHVIEPGDPVPPDKCPECGRQVVVNIIGGGIRMEDL